MMTATSTSLHGFRNAFLPGFEPPPDQPFQTDNPREIRIIKALAIAPRTREELDRIAGASNVPDAIKAMRQRGLEISSKREPVRDRDGKTQWRGRYAFSDADLRRTRSIWDGGEYGE